MAKRKYGIQKYTVVELVRLIHKVGRGVEVYSLYGCLEYMELVAQPAFLICNLRYCLKEKEENILWQT